MGAAPRAAVGYLVLARSPKTRHDCSSSWMKLVMSGRAIREEILDLFAAAIGYAKPDQLWWATLEDSSFLKARVFRNNRETIFFGIVPNGHRCAGSNDGRSRSHDQRYRGRRRWV